MLVASNSNYNFGSISKLVCTHPKSTYSVPRAGRGNKRRTRNSSCLKKLRIGKEDKTTEHIIKTKKQQSINATGVHPVRAEESQKGGRFTPNLQGLKNKMLHGGGGSWAGLWISRISRNSGWRNEGWQWEGREERKVFHLVVLVM